MGRVHETTSRVILHAESGGRLEDIRITIAPTKRGLEKSALLEFALYCERFDGRRPIMKCVQCGKWFQGTRRDSKTCSATCCNRYFRRQWRGRIGEKEYRRRQRVANKRMRAKQKRVKSEIEKLRGGAKR